ncbi:MAG: hypothetical protein IT379_40005 [Deltaproteobacteria bacterium]|nr:hypothetical protein [Deltaproteobacteria bacterium]
MSETLKMLPVKLDVVEREQRARELADLLHETEAAEIAEAERRRAAKDAAEARKTRASDLARIVRNGTENRPTLVAEHANTVRWTIDYVRLDTGECYESRPMSASEREKAAQLALWGGPVEAKMASAPEPEPGRNDTLPEAADVKRPKRGEPKTKADKLVADAAGESTVTVPA